MNQDQAVRLIIVALLGAILAVALQLSENVRQIRDYERTQVERME